MLQAHAWGLAAGYAAASVVAGYAAIHVATAMVRRVRLRPVGPREKPVRPRAESMSGRASESEGTA
jgi:hypothetical protein